MTIMIYNSYHATPVKMSALHVRCALIPQQSVTTHYWLVLFARAWSLLWKERGYEIKEKFKNVAFFNPHSSFLFASLKSVVCPSAPGSNSKLTLS